MKELAALLFLLLGGVTTAQDPLDIQMPPIIIEQGPLQILYQTGDEVVLPCRATGVPAPWYEWIVNDGAVDLNARNIKMSPEDGTITLEPITSLDEGYYQCIAKNQHGKDISGLTVLKRAVLGRYPPISEQIYKGKEGESLKVPCQEIKSVPMPTFAWALGKDIADESPTPLALNRRIQIDENGHLYFAYLTEDDARDGRVYKCNVFNNYLDVTTGGSYSKVQVESGSMENREPALMFSTPSPRIALRGQTEVRLKCFFSGMPAPRISWVRVGGALPSGRYAMEAADTELVINNIQESDKGEYQCTATNTAGTSTPITVRLDVQSKPEFVPGLQPRNMNATEKGKVEFNCQAEAEPPATIEWFINGDPVSELDPDPRRMFSEDGTKFTITDLCKDCADRPSDLMVVQCNASNIHGYKLASGYLNVLEAKTGGVSRLWDFGSYSICCLMAMLLHMHAG